MNFPQLSSIGISIQLDKGIPGSYTGFLLSADTWYSEGRFGMLIIQQRLIIDKWLRYYILKPKEKITLSIEGSESWLQLMINLDTVIKLQEPNERRVQVRKGQYFLKNGTLKKKTIELKAGKEYEFLEVWYALEKVGQFEPAFPILKNLPTKSQWVLPENEAIINEIIKNPYTEAALSIYYDIALENILFFMLLQSAHSPLVDASDFEIEATHKAKKILEENVRNYPDIKGIAQQVGLTDYKLKQLFRKIYNKSAFDLFIKAKMDMAYRLVTTTNESIKSIAIDTGYKWPMNFATAFRQRFGEAPETLREKIRNIK